MISYKHERLLVKCMQTPSFVVLLVCFELAGSIFGGRLGFSEPNLAWLCIRGLLRIAFFL